MEDPKATGLPVKSGSHYAAMLLEGNCATKPNFIAEYALRDINKPMGVAEYETKIVSSLPKKLEGKLPTIKEIEAELSVIPRAATKKKKSKEKKN